MATFPANNKVPGNAGLTTDLDTTYGLLQNILGPVVLPSGDTTGATDAVNVQNAITTYGYATIVAGLGPYYGKTTVTGNEGQFLNCIGIPTWNMKATGIAAFQWKQANAATYSTTGTGGIRGRLIINGPGGANNPSDGSIGVQMADIVQLECDVAVFQCQWGILMSNQNFFTEQAQIRLFSQGNTNPLVLQTAASGGASRTGSFDRGEFTVYHNDVTNASAGLGGVQLLAGALVEGGWIKQYGNFNGTGSAGKYALYVSGTAPVGGFHSAIVGAQIIHAVEYDGTGTAIGTVFLDTGCYIIHCEGTLDYVGMGAPSISATNAGFTFHGPIAGNTALLNALNLTVTTGFPAGVTGTVTFIPVGVGYGTSGGVSAWLMNFNLTVAATTTITSGSTFFTLPALAVPTSGTYVGGIVYNALGSPSTDPIVLTVNSGGGAVCGFVSATITTPGGGNSFIRGTAVYGAAF